MSTPRAKRCDRCRMLPCVCLPRTVKAELLWVNPNHHADVREQLTQLRADLARVKEERDQLDLQIQHAAANQGIAVAEAARLRERLQKAIADAKEAERTHRYGNDGGEYLTPFMAAVEQALAPDPEPMT